MDDLDRLNFNKPIIGFRSWECDPYSLRLQAISKRGSWIPEENIASCGKCASSPGANCHCGFNAYFDFKKAVGLDYGVVGAIAGAGNIQIHSRGFRSSKAQILGLYDNLFQNTPPDIDIPRIAKYYGVPVFSDLDQLLEIIDESRFLTGENLQASIPVRNTDWNMIWPVDSINGQPSTDYVQSQDGVFYRTQEWFKNGFLHRDGDKPAIICSRIRAEEIFITNKQESLYNQTIFHPRETESWDKKAWNLAPFIRFSTTELAEIQVWLQLGQRHRLNGPAVIYGEEGYEHWVAGERHCEDGPAVGFAGGYEEYWIRGKQCDRHGNVLDIQLQDLLPG